MAAKDFIIFILSSAGGSIVVALQINLFAKHSERVYRKRRLADSDSC